MRLATLPAAVAVERAPIRAGEICAAELLELGPPRPHIDLGTARAIYARTTSSGKPPAVCVEYGTTARHDACVFRFIFTTNALAEHWTSEFIEIARKERR